ncbi:MAG TPA: pentapeptide repeat-containing protein [Candidatus Saccharimonadales bacterium]|nr:pentapeptide repeat-containing protein [Candidatus Saccharimonadales bacterium]
MKRIIFIFIILSVCDITAFNPYHITLVKSKSFAKVPIQASGRDFRGAGTLLQGINFRNAQLSGTAFNTPSKATTSPFLITVIGQQTDLTKGNFSKAELVSTNFNGAILQKANFNGANILNANFAGADLKGATFNGAENIETAVFCGATMPDGTVCSSGSWTNKSGQVFQCACQQKK